MRTQDHKDNGRPIIGVKTWGHLEGGDPMHPMEKFTALYPETGTGLPMLGAPRKPWIKGKSQR